ALGIVEVAGSVVIVPVVIGAARVDVAGGRLDIHHRRGGDVNRIVVVIARAIDRGVEAGAVVAAAAVVSSAVVAVAEVAAVVVDGGEAEVVVATAAESEGEAKAASPAGLSPTGRQSQRADEQKRNHK